MTPVSDYSSKLDDLDMSEEQFSLSNHFVVNLTIRLDTEIITNWTLSVFTMAHDSWSLGLCQIRTPVRFGTVVQKNVTFYVRL